MFRLRLVGVLLAPALGAAGCGGAGGGSSPRKDAALNNSGPVVQANTAVSKKQTTRSKAPAASRAAAPLGVAAPKARPFCAPARKLMRDEQVFLPSDVSGNAYAYQDALAFIQAHKREMQQIVRHAPAQVREAAHLKVAALRAQVGLAKVGAQRAREADATFKQYVRSHC